MSIEIEQIRIDDINKDSRLNVLKWVKRPDLIAVARIMDTSANLVGLNMYNYKTKKTKATPIYDVFKMCLAGEVVAGIKVDLNYSNEKLHNGLKLMESISLNFDSICYDYRRLPAVDEGGSLVGLGADVIVGMTTKHLSSKNMFVLMDYKGSVVDTKEIYEIEQSSEYYIGMNHETMSDIAVTALADYECI